MCIQVYAYVCVCLYVCVWPECTSTFSKHVIQLPHLTKLSPGLNSVVSEFSGGDMLPLVSDLVKLDNYNAIWFCCGGRIKLLTLENEFFPLRKRTFIKIILVTERGKCTSFSSSEAGQGIIST